MSMPAFYRSTLKETKLVTETLDGIQSSDERAHSVWKNILIVIEDNKIVAAEKAAGTPSSKLVERYNEIISTCTRTIKDNLSKLGANEATINEIMGYVDHGDTDNAQISLLQLLVKRNPGLYRRRVAAIQKQK